MSDSLSAHMLLVCGPSGVGKSTLVARILDRWEAASLSVSYTTRQRRPKEVDGVHYHFVSRARFAELREADAFAEWAEVHGNLYGTSTQAIEEAQSVDRDLLFDIDYQGARQLKARFPQSWGVLVVPPNMAKLEARLRGRGTENEASVSRRLRNAREELAQVALFDFVITNDDLDRACDEIEAIYRAMRARRTRRDARVHALLAE